MTDPRRQSSPNRARSSSNAVRSRLLWTMPLWTFIWRRHLRKNTTKRALWYVQWLKTLTQVDSILTHPHIPSPHWHQRRKSHSDAAEITLKKLASFSSIRLRGVVMARNRKGHPYCDVTTIRQTRYFRSDNVRFQDGDAVDIGKLGRGGRFLPTTPSFFQCLPLHRFMLSSRTRIRLQFYYGAAVCATFGNFFLYDVCQYAWRIASIIFNNVSLCPLILIPNMSGLLCPLLLNPGSRFASWMRATHYTTRASRNECSTVGACSLHATQVPNSCRKWHNIYILVLIHSPLYMSHTTLRWVVNVLSFPSMPMQSEVWAVSNLTLVLLTFAIIYTLNDRSFV